MDHQNQAFLPDDLVIGDVRISVRQRTVNVNTAQVAFTRREFDMLYLLAKHPGWAYTKEQLLGAAWGKDRKSVV